jgi:hypothetical protein
MERTLPADRLLPGAPSAPQSATVLVLPERRRRGRLDQVNPHLIPLLRGNAPTAPRAPPPLDFASSAANDDVPAVRRTLIGTALTIALGLLAFGSLTLALLHGIL